MLQTSKQTETQTEVLDSALTFLLAPALALQKSGVGTAAFVWKATKSDWVFFFFFCDFLALRQGESPPTGCE